MTSAEQPPPPSAPAADPEKEAEARVKTLKDQARALEHQMRSTEGRVKNRNPHALKKTQAEVALLTERLNKLEQVLYALFVDAVKARSADELKAKYDQLRLSTIDFCKRNNVDVELWKNIAS